MKKAIHTFVFVFFNLILSAQVDFDSLWGIWNDSSQHDTMRLRAIDKIAWEGYLFKDPDSASFYAKLEYELAAKINNRRWMGEALNTQGVADWMKGNYPGAIKTYSENLKLYEHANDKRGIASSYNNIGLIYNDQKEFEKALEYYRKALFTFELANDTVGIAMAIINIGSIYDTKGDLDSAIYYYRRSLNIYESLNDKFGVAGSLNNLGLVFKQKMELDSSFIYLDNARILFEEINNYRGLAVSFNNIGHIHILRKRFQEALKYCQRAYDIAVEMQSLVEIKNAARYLYQSYKSLGKYDKALEMYEISVKMHDSIQSEENKREIVRQEFKYEYEKKAAADSVVFAKEKELSEAEIARKNAEIRIKNNTQYALFGGLFIVIVFAGISYNRFKVTRKQKRIIEAQKQLVEEQKNVVEDQVKIIGEKHKEITDSIRYAKRIQDAILPSIKDINAAIGNGFVLYIPKDVVAGDFYWMETFQNRLYIAAADCTGHGVPGAMVSVICSNALSKALLEEGVKNTGKLLDRTREIVIEQLARSGEEVNDGMDISLCSIDHEKMSLEWSGANNPLWIIRNSGNNEVDFLEFPPDKQPIGKAVNLVPFTSHKVPLQKGDSVYIFTDGFIDQFGGEKGKKFKSANLKRLLMSVADKTPEQQKNILTESFETWKGEIEQVDDICIIGMKF